MGLGNKSYEIPSVLYREADGTFLVGDAAERRGLTDPAHVVREFKRRLGDPVPILVGGTPYSPQMLTAQLLRWVLGEATQRMGRPPEKVVLTHPASWTTFKIDCLHQAAALADIPRVQTYPEPVAAAREYANSHPLSCGDRICVFDLGGGTFDVAVLERTDSDFAVLGVPTGIEHLGGIDFDQGIFSAVLRDASSRLRTLDLTVPQVEGQLIRLRRDCVDAKEALSADVDTVISTRLAGEEIAFRLTRGEFEENIRPIVLESVESVRRALRSANISPHDLTAVVLVGGSSKIPLVTETLTDAFRRPVLRSTNPKNDIALGATYMASGVAEEPGTGAIDGPGAVLDLPTTVNAIPAYQPVSHNIDAIGDTTTVDVITGAQRDRSASLDSWQPEPGTATALLTQPPPPQPPTVPLEVRGPSRIDTQHPRRVESRRATSQRPGSRRERERQTRLLAIAAAFIAAVAVVLSAVTIAESQTQTSNQVTAGSPAPALPPPPTTSLPQTVTETPTSNSPPTNAPISADVSAATITSTSDSAAPSETPSDDEAVTWLTNRVVSDSPKVELHLDQWIPIVSSKQTGAVDPVDLQYPNQPYTNGMIVQNFQYWLGRYPDALLAASSSYSSHHPGWWITLIPRPSPTPQATNDWCRREGLSPNDCHATRVSHTLSPGPDTSVPWSE
jgi:actin-like ATPase involved in cell morphogenesis